MDYNTQRKKFYYFIVYYKPNDFNEEKVKNLGKDFIKNNKNKCQIIFKNKVYELKTFLEDIDKNYNHKDLIKLKIKFIHNILNLNYMFYKSNSLISLLDNDKTDINNSSLPINIVSMSNMFY